MDTYDQNWQTGSAGEKLRELENRITELEREIRMEIKRMIDEDLKLMGLK